MITNYSCLLFKGRSLCSDVCPLPPLLSLGTSRKTLAPAFCPFTSTVHIEKMPQLLFLSGTSSPSSLSLSTRKKYSSPSIVFGPAQELDPAGPGGQGAAASRPSLVPLLQPLSLLARGTEQASDGLRSPLPCPEGHSGDGLPWAWKGRPGQEGKAGLGWPCRAGLVRAMPERAGMGRIEQGWAEPGRAGRARQGRVGQGWAGQGWPRPGAPHRVSPLQLALLVSEGRDEHLHAGSLSAAAAPPPSARRSRDSPAT